MASGNHRAMEPFDARGGALVCAVTATLLGCYDTHGQGPDASSVHLSEGGAPIVLVPYAGGYEVSYFAIPSAPWFDTPPSGRDCWPVRYQPEFSAEAVANLTAALDSWAAPCTRFCFDAPTADATLHAGTEDPGEGLRAVYFPDAGPPLPLEAGADGVGSFGEVRTRTVAIYVGTGRTPSVREWARAIGYALGLNVASGGRPSSVLRGDLALEEGATPSDRAALCHFFPAGG